MNEDAIYFRRRGLEERTAALSATDARARRVHLELAHRYEGAIREMIVCERRNRIRLLEAV